MKRSPERVKQVLSFYGLKQDGFAKACDFSVATAGRWVREGIPDSADDSHFAAFVKLEEKLPPDPQDAIVRARIAGALPDLPHADLAALLADVKRRQLAALSREFGQGEAEPDPDAVQDRARRSADNDGPNQANAG